jgi:hypothetical protein
MEVEVAAEPEATAMEMATDMATGIAMGTVTETAMEMVMDVATETAMETVMDVGTEMAMEMVTEMAMCLVVEEVEAEEAPQAVVAEVGVEEEEAVAVGAAAAALVEVVVAEVVVDMNFALGSHIIQVLMWRLAFSGHVASTGSQHITTSMLYSFSAGLCA